MPGASESCSNTVYVDNVVEAIIRALAAPAELSRGQAHPISDGDEWTWGDYYGFFARKLGVQLRTEEEAVELPGDVTPDRGAIGWARSWWRCGSDVVRSPEFRAFGRRVIESEPLGRLPRGLLERGPGLDRWLRQALGSGKAEIYRRPVEFDGTMRIPPGLNLIRIESARRNLGYEPIVQRERAMDLTADWWFRGRV
jgi:nucleoside-diphosphate-sugar epimerase